MRLDFTRVRTDLGFIEGPTIMPDGALCGVSLSHGCVFEVSDGQVSVVAKLGGAPNGSAVDSNGTLFVAQNGGHCPGMPRRRQTGGIQRIHPDGQVDYLTDDPIAPNDVSFGPDGLLYFTDPTRQEQRDDGRIWRADPVSGEAELLTSVAWFPNGLAFGRAGELYVTSTFEDRVYVFDPSDMHGAPGACYAELGAHPDGMAVGADGCLVVATVGGPGESGALHVVDPDGAVADVIDTGSSRYITNVAITATGRLHTTDADQGVVMSADFPIGGLPVHPIKPNSL